MKQVNEDTPVSKDTDSRADLQTVIDLVLRQEQDRNERAARRSEKRIRAELKRRKLSEKRLREAVHIIKWCVVGICSAMLLGLILAIWALFQVEKAVVEVEREVKQVTSRVDKILHEVEHPFEGAGKLLGRDLDQSVAEFFGLQPFRPTQE